MKQKLQEANRSRAGIGSGVWLSLAGVGLLMVAVLIFRARRSDDPSAAGTMVPPEDMATAPAQAASFKRAPAGREAPPTETGAASGPPSSPAAPPPSEDALALPAPSAESRQWVKALTEWDVAGGPLTAERVTEWKENLQRMIQGGAASVPAVAEFLRLNKDNVFSAEQGRQLGFGSARAAMFDALVTIGGPEAAGVLNEALETTASPREIALLARNLETLAPEQYRGQAVEAARQSLAMAVEKRLEGFDVAPLFEVMERYGGADVIADLERSTSKWNYYATLALGNLPDGAGVPSLIRMVEVGPDKKPDPGRLQALQVLSQLASSNPDARAALVRQVQENQIAPNLWAYLARPLSGDQAHVQDSVLNENRPVLASAKTSASHIRNSNQNFFYAPPGGGLTPEQANQQLTLVSELSAATSNADALKVLQRTRTLLEQRLGKANAAAPVPP